MVLPIIVFYYERQLRASREFSNIHDRLLLQGRNKSRSRSKSISRIASNISLGKLFPRSRSNSPSRRSSIDKQEEGSLIDQKSTSHVPDPMIDIATMERKYRNQQTYSGANLHLTSAQTITNTNYVAQNHHPSEYNKTKKRTTQPRLKTRPLSAIFTRHENSFMEYFDRDKQQQLSRHYSHNNEDTGALRYHEPQQEDYPSLDTLLFNNLNMRNVTPELIPSHESTSGTPSGDQNTMSSSQQDDTTSSVGSHYSFYNNNHSISSSVSSSYFGSDNRSYRDEEINNEKLMCIIDGSKRVRAPPISDVSFYCQSPQPIKFQSTPLSTLQSAHITNDDINSMINELIHSQQHSTREKKMNSINQYSRFNRQQRF